MAVYPAPTRLPVNEVFNLADWTETENSSLTLAEANQKYIKKKGSDTVLSTLLFAAPINFIGTLNDINPSEFYCLDNCTENIKLKFAALDGLFVDYGLDIQANTTAISVLNVTTVPAINTLISDNYSTLDTKIDTKTTETYVDNALNSLIAGSPYVLDTLYEIATALNNDPDFYGTISTLIYDNSSAITSLQTATTGITYTPDKTIIDNDVYLNPSHEITTGTYHITNQFDETFNLNLTTPVPFNLYRNRIGSGTINIQNGNTLNYQCVEIRNPTFNKYGTGNATNVSNLYIQAPTAGTNQNYAINALGLSRFNSVQVDTTLTCATINGYTPATWMASIGANASNITALQGKTTNQSFAGTTTTFAGTLASTTLTCTTVNGYTPATWMASIGTNTADITALQGKTTNQSFAGTTTTFAGTLASTTLTCVSLNGYTPSKFPRIDITNYFTGAANNFEGNLFVVSTVGLNRYTKLSDEGAVNRPTGAKLLVSNSKVADAGTAGTVGAESVYNQAQFGTQFCIAQGATTGNVYMGQTNGTVYPDSQLTLKRNVGLKIDGAGTNTTDFVDDLHVVGTAKITDALTCGGLTCTSFTNGTVSNLELNYLDGATSSIQTQINSTVSATGTNTTSIGTINGTLTSLQGQITSNDGDITAINGSKANLNSPTFTGAVSAVELSIQGNFFASRMYALPAASDLTISAGYKPLKMTAFVANVPNTAGVYLLNGGTSAFYSYPIFYTCFNLNNLFSQPATSGALPSGGVGTYSFMSLNDEDDKYFVLPGFRVVGYDNVQTGYPLTGTILLDYYNNTYRPVVVAPSTVNRVAAIEIYFMGVVISTPPSGTF